MIVYEVAKWAEVYETAESRRHKSLTWVSMPISFTSSGYQSMLDSFGDEAAAMYGTWCVLVSFAAQCPTRGRLGNTQGVPVSLSAIARVTGFPENNFRRLIEWASRPNVRWLVAATCDVETTYEPAQATPSHCPGDAQANAGLPNLTQQNLTKPNKTISVGSSEADSEAVKEFVEAWNASPGVVRVRNMTPKRLKHLRTRLSEAHWDWRTALNKFPLKCFANDPNGWKPDIDWILSPDSVTKILEGKYDWEKTSKQTQFAMVDDPLGPDPLEKF